MLGWQVLDACCKAFAQDHPLSTLDKGSMQVCVVLY
jgi:hypothetical protein